LDFSRFSKIFVSKQLCYLKRLTIITFQPLISHDLNKFNIVFSGKPRTSV